VHIHQHMSAFFNLQRTVGIMKELICEAHGDAVSVDT